MDLVYLIDEMCDALFELVVGNEEYRKRLEVIANKINNIIAEIIQWHVVGYIEEYYPHIKDKEVIEEILIRTMIHIYSKIITYANAFLVYHVRYIMDGAIRYAFITDDVEELSKYLVGCRYTIKYGIFRTVDRLIREVMGNE